jgi:hypothetical protein
VTHSRLSLNRSAYVSLAIDYLDAQRREIVAELREHGYEIVSEDDFEKSIRNGNYIGLFSKRLDRMKAADFDDLIYPYVLKNGVQLVDLLRKFIGPGNDGQYDVEIYHQMVESMARAMRKFPLFGRDAWEYTCETLHSRGLITTEEFQNLEEYPRDQARNEEETDEDHDVEGIEEETEEDEEEEEGVRTICDNNNASGEWDRFIVQISTGISVAALTFLLIFLTLLLQMESSLTGVRLSTW